MKPPEVLARDRLVGVYEVRPVLRRLRATMSGSGVALAVAGALLLGAVRVEGEATGECGGAGERMGERKGQSGKGRGDGGGEAAVRAPLAGGGALPAFLVYCFAHTGSDLSPALAMLTRGSRCRCVCALLRAQAGRGPCRGRRPRAASSTQPR